MIVFSFHRLIPLLRFSIAIVVNRQTLSWLEFGVDRPETLARLQLSYFDISVRVCQAILVRYFTLVQLGFVGDCCIGWLGGLETLAALGVAGMCFLCVFGGPF